MNGNGVALIVDVRAPSPVRWCRCSAQNNVKPMSRPVGRVGAC